MAKFSIEIDDDYVPIVLSALGYMYKYKPTIDNPTYDLDYDNKYMMIDNPNYKPTTIDNPNYDPNVEETAENSPIIPNDQYDINIPQQIVDPSYDLNHPDRFPTITNPESIFKFANRMVREWLVQNVEAYQVETAANLARDTTLAQIAITNIKSKMKRL